VEKICDGEIGDEGNIGEYETFSIALVAFLCFFMGGDDNGNDGNGNDGNGNDGNGNGDGDEDGNG